MRIHHFILFIILLFTYAASAQSRGFMSAALGKGIPTGRYGSMNFENGTSGFAVAGWTFDLSLGFKAGQRMGFMMNFHNQENYQKSDLLGQEYRNLYPDKTIKMYNDGWRVTGFFLGTFVELPISEKVSFQPRVQLGYARATLPGIRVQIEGTEHVEFARARTQGTVSLATLIGGSLRINGSQNLSLSFNADYLYTNPEFVRVSTTYFDKSGMPIPKSSTYSTFRQQISSMNLSIGLGFWF